MQLEAFELAWRRMKNSFLKKQDLKDRLELDKKKKEAYEFVIVFVGHISTG